MMDAGQARLASFDDIRLSFWSYNLYKTCPQKFILLAHAPRQRYVRDNYWAIAGSTIHSLWEDFITLLKDGKADWNEAKDFLLDNTTPYYDNFISGENVNWKAHEVSPEEHRADAIPGIRRSCTYLLDQFETVGLIPRDPATIHSELTFKTPLVNPLTGEASKHVKVTGRTDLVFEDKDSIDIIDLKDVWKRSSVDWRQLMWYGFGLEPHFNKPVNRAGFLLTRLQD